MRTFSTSSPAPQESPTTNPTAIDSPPVQASATPTRPFPENFPKKPDSHGPNYEWVVGRLEYSDLEGGTWTLHYMPNPGEEDPYGGKLVLQGEVPNKFQTGVTVKVTGSIAEQQTGINMAGTYYELKSISPTNLKQ